MKLKKHNYAATAAIVLYCFACYKSFSYKRFTVLLVVITSLFSSYIYSQQPTISGLENIHISDGAAIITEDAEENITVVTAQSVVTYSKRDKSNFDIPKVVKSNSVLNKKNKKELK